jgi:hypothetical protein
MLGVFLHAPRSPFYSPKAARSRWKPTWKANLAFCRVVHHRTATVHVRCMISFHTESNRPLVLGIGWRTGHCPVHIGQSIVPNRPLARPRVARRLRGRSLSLATVGSPDSPVNHRTVQWIIATLSRCFSRERRVHRGWLIGPVNYSRMPASLPETGYFTGGLPRAPDTVRCARPCGEFISSSFLLSLALFLALR